MNEEWRAVPGFEGLYEVSDLGRVRNLSRDVTFHPPTKRAYTRRIPARVLRPGPKSSGHLTVMLGRDGGSKQVHALVLAAFVGPKPAGLEIRHLNGCPTDNRLDNLEYATRSVNLQDKKWHEHRPSGYVLRPKDVIQIKQELKAGQFGSVLSQRFNVAQSTISAIKHGRFHNDI